MRGQEFTLADDPTDWKDVRPLGTAILGLGPPPADHSPIPASQILRILLVRDLVKFRVSKSEVPRVKKPKSHWAREKVEDFSSHIKKHDLV